MSFTIAQDNNVAGLSLLQLSFVYNLSSLNPVTFTGTNDWVTIDFLEETGQLVEDSADSDNGTQFTYTLTFGFNKKRSDLIASIAPYLGTTAIARVIDNNGLTQLIGNLQSPVTLTQNTNTGIKFGDENLVLITGTVIQDTAAITFDDTDGGEGTGNSDSGGGHDIGGLPGKPQ